MGHGGLLVVVQVQVQVHVRAWRMRTTRFARIH